MGKLLIYLKDYKKESILAPLFKMLEASFELLVPIVMKLIIDVGISSHDKSYVLNKCIILILLGVIGLTCSITAQYFSAKAAVGFAAKVRINLFKHIQTLSFSEMDNMGTSTMITRMTSDINQVQSGVNLVLRLFMRSPFIVFGAMIMAFTINAEAALIFVVAIPLLSIIVFGVMLISIPLYKKVQSRLDVILRLTRENLTGARVIRAFHKEEDEINDFNDSNMNLTKLQLFVGRILGIMNPVTYVIVNGAIVVLLWTGAIKVSNGTLTTGAVIALVSYMSQILVELIKLANLIINVTKSIACGNRVQNVLDMKPSIDKNKALNNIDVEQENIENDSFIEFKRVALKYSEAGDEALSEVSFSVKRGETIGIIGGTGSGKSSLVHLIPRFYDVTAGEILINGRDIKEYDVAKLRQKIGIVMQKAVLFKGTIRENLCWGKSSASDLELQEALRISQSKEFVDQKEKGLETMIDQGGKNLSGGQKQRLTIARALVKNPEVLILDDSASALDYATDAKLRTAISNMKNKPTVFIVSQRSAAVRFADKIVVLDDGRVSGIGTHEKLLEDCEIYQEICHSQNIKKQEAI
ncbi:ABC transporter ATP-binding protein [Clostridium oryzae]|uniref:Putative multidrug export ATP-binding/permease protein n=1 Tax=Clostridium oryzae TaxID=1450648 RepID=A0A1V4IY99_9CLOT|nr:ABC transporter ATP-binding protein [Clostridium oryzae]OPJ64879.1 putative multidrug export ATP-binding/permease protein [Clostridium oryzae]